LWSLLDWLDFSFDPKRRFPDLDMEWRGVDFVDPRLAVSANWKKFWPQTGNIPNWDAVGFCR